MSDKVGVVGMGETVSHLITLAFEDSFEDCRLAYSVISFKTVLRDRVSQIARKQERGTRETRYQDFTEGAFIAIDTVASRKRTACPSMQCSRDIGFVLRCALRSASCHERQRLLLFVLSREFVCDSNRQPAALPPNTT
jgi:hypothetical protein